MPAKSFTLNASRSRLRVISNKMKAGKNAKLVHLPQRAESNAQLMPPVIDRYIKAENHDFL